MENEIKTKNGTESLEMFRGRLRAYENIGDKIMEEFNKLDPKDTESMAWWMKFQQLVIKAAEEDKS